MSFYDFEGVEKEPGFSFSLNNGAVSLMVEMGCSWEESCYLTQSEFGEFSDIWIRVERRGKQFQQRHYLGSIEAQAITKKA